MAIAVLCSRVIDCFQEDEYRTDKLFSIFPWSDARPNMAILSPALPPKVRARVVSTVEAHSAVWDKPMVSTAEAVVFD